MIYLPIKPFELWHQGLPEGLSEASECSALPASLSFTPEAFYVLSFAASSFLPQSSVSPHSWGQLLIKSRHSAGQTAQDSHLKVRATLRTRVYLFARMSVKRVHSRCTESCTESASAEKEEEKE